MQIGVFMTYGNSLTLWEESGILSREMAIYEEHAKSNHRFTLISYGNADDTRFEKCYPFLKVIVNQWAMPTRLYSRLIPSIAGNILKQMDVIKTNQMHGAHVAAIPALRFQKPLYIRQGYSFFESEQGKWGENSKKTERARRYERENAVNADWLSFPTERMAADFVGRNPVTDGKVSVVSNYVSETAWSPQFNPHRRGKKLRLVYFGKFTEQKNLVNLIDACSGLDVEIDLIGSGNLADQLCAHGQENGLTIRFHPRLEQNDLREVLRYCDCFVLPSNYEGQPKALLEAMAFGMPVIGSNVPGIIDLIEDGGNGVLVATSVEGIREGILRVLAASPKELAIMGVNARAFALGQHGLKKVSDKDFEILTKLAKRNAHSG
jgi:glycosyltransferase involved in cell wall biosynthesis